MKTNKKKVGVAILIGVLAIAITLFSLLTVGWNQSAGLHLFLGERYMDELDYEQALAEFAKAIEIDPKNVDAYELMASAYEELGRPDRALDVLANGYLKTSSKQIEKKADKDYDVDIKTSFTTVDDKVVVKEAGLDLCFVIDTTGSMSGAIEDAKENMESIIEKVAEKTNNYRIAIVDYRDFADRSGNSNDYPAKVQLDFTSDSDAIQSGINRLSLGHGGDDAETVYSGLMTAAALEWRTSAQHVIIWIGDAEPLDPEPYTDYTYDDVMEALRTGNAEVNLDAYLSEIRDDSGEYVTVHAVASEEYGEDEEKSSVYYNITTYGIVTNYGDISSFERVCDETGGSVSDAFGDSSVSDEICEIIEQVEIVPVARDAEVDFGRKYGKSLIEVYGGMKIVKDVKLDSSGEGVLESMPFGSYFWRDRTTGAYGYMTNAADSDKVSISVAKEPGAASMMKWELLAAVSLSVLLMFAAGALVVLKRIKKVKIQ